MKARFGLLLLVMALVLSMPMFAAAKTPFGNFSEYGLPTDAWDSDVIYYLPWDGFAAPPTTINGLTGWVGIADGQEFGPARAANSGGKQQLLTNQEVTTATFTHNASVAQWVKWNASVTQKDWFVRQPGLYYSDGIGLDIASNSNVVVTFGEDFNNLQYVVDSTNPDEAAVIGQGEIETWYALRTPQGPGEWVKAADLDTLSLGIENTSALHKPGNSYLLYTAIQVEPCNSAGEYTNTGTVSFTLQNMKPWIVAGNGSFLM